MENLENALEFNEKGHIIALKLDKYYKRILDTNQIRMYDDRCVKDFKIEWGSVPVFAVITGSNGSGKSYLLEQIRNCLKINGLKNSGKSDIKFTYLGPDQLDPFSGFSRFKNFDSLTKNPGDWIKYIFNFIKKIPNDYGKVRSQISEYEVKLVAECLISNNIDIHEKDDNEIRKIILNQSMRKNFISCEPEIEFDLQSLIYSLQSCYLEERSDLCKGFKDICRILDEPYYFWLEQNPNSTIEDFRIFLRDNENIDTLINQLVDKNVPTPDVVKQINQLLPGSFPYQFVLIALNKSSQTLCCYPRHMDICSQINHEKLVQLEHLSSGEQMVLKVISFVFYSQGLRCTTEERKVVSKPNIILLDEPDRHLDPKLCKIFFDAVYSVLVQQEGIQVIMTTHRMDTVAISPEGSVYILDKGTIKCQKQSALDRMSENIIPAGSKRNALSTLSDGMITITRDLKYVMVEGDYDVIFYSIVYKKFLDTFLLKPFKTELIFISAGVKIIDERNLNALWENIQMLKELSTSQTHQDISDNCLRIVQSLKDSNENGGGCDQVKKRLRIKLFDIQCNTKGQVTNAQCSKKLKVFPEEHEPDLIWGLLDRDKGRKSERKIRALDDVHSIENYLCMPINIFYIMKITDDDFYGDQLKQIGKRLEDNPNSCQEAVDYVISYIKKETEKKGKEGKIISLNIENLKDLKLAGGATIQCPKSFFKTQGHTLQKKIMSLLDIKDQKVMRDYMEKALKEIPSIFLPASLVKTFEDIISDQI